jgi:hypothetical protein
MYRGRGITQAITEDYIKTPSALTMWAYGTGVLGGIATIILTKRAEAEGWTRFKTEQVLMGILLASALNLIIAAKMEGER